MPQKPIEQALTEAMAGPAAISPLPAGGERGRG